MRTTPTDTGRGLFVISGGSPDAASGAGVAAPGIPYTYTRGIAGSYQYRIDPALLVIGGVVTPGPLGTYFAVLAAVGPGTFTVGCYSGFGVGANSPHQFVVTVRDLRR